MMAQEPIKAAGGWVRITDSSNFFPGRDHHRGGAGEH
jgi:hypothetical protein